MAEPTTSEMDTPIESPAMGETASEGKAPAMDAAAELEATRAALKKANAEAAKYRKAVEAAETEKKAKEEAEMTELQKAQKRLAELETAYAAKELAERKRAVAEKVGIPPALAARLQGASDEELEQDAKALLESLPKPAEPPKKPSGINPTNPANATTGETPAQQKARIFGTSPDIFDPEWGKAHGGGFFINTKD